MRADEFMDALPSEFYAGVPDSLLRPFLDCLMKRYGTDPQHHVIAANEGNCAALAAGYHLATGRVPTVYLQNSGEGNLLNPYASLLHGKVYGIPVIFVIGWRGEPGTKDEPQHAFQGEITCRLLELLSIPYFVIGLETTLADVKRAADEFQPLWKEGKCTAFVVRKGALSGGEKAAYGNGHSMLREEVLRHVAEAAGEGVIVATTGKASRELFEIREARGEGHERDFLTVGSMGHSLSIATGIALHCPERRVWCVDGDGAALMHMGSLAVAGAVHPANLVHVVINNEAHESVGGMPTVMGQVDLPAIARGCGYAHVASSDCPEELEKELQALKGQEGPCFLEAKCRIGSRKDLGRPTTAPQENKRDFMEFLQNAMAPTDWSEKNLQVTQASNGIKG